MAADRNLEFSPPWQGGVGGVFRTVTSELETGQGSDRRAHTTRKIEQSRLTPPAPPCQGGEKNEALAFCRGTASISAVGIHCFKTLNASALHWPAATGSWPFSGLRSCQAQTMSGSNTIMNIVPKMNVGATLF